MTARRRDKVDWSAWVEEVAADGRRVLVTEPRATAGPDGAGGAPASRQAGRHGVWRTVLMRRRPDHPPFLERLPGFFLLRVAVPRSRLRFWPLPVVMVWPATGVGRGVALRSASVLIFWGMVTPWLINAITLN